MCSLASEIWDSSIYPSIRKCMYFPEYEISKRLQTMLNPKFAIFLILSKQCKNPSKYWMKTLAWKRHSTGCCLTDDQQGL